MSEGASVIDMGALADNLVRVAVCAVESERAAIAAKAREWAQHYDPGSDGRNTFVLFAEWVEARAKLQGEKK